MNNIEQPQFPNPHSDAHWKRVTEELMASGAAVDVTITHCAALSIPIIYFLQFTEDLGLDLSPLSTPVWYRNMDEIESTGASHIINRWTASRPDRGRLLRRNGPLAPAGTLYKLEYSGMTALVSLPSSQKNLWTCYRELLPIAVGCSSEAALFQLYLAYGNWEQSALPLTQVWGGSTITPDTTPVTESDVILPEELKQDLLSYIDRFWRYAPRARNRCIPHRRGILLAGRPGTGKSHLIRHLFTRFPQVKRHLFIPAWDRHSSSALDALVAHLITDASPAMVIVEDIDRLFAEHSVKPAHFLNTMDGLLSPDVPLLWIATTNDPSALQANLLDRPGRFDRIVVIPEPAPLERAALLRIFSNRPFGSETQQKAIQASDGLTGAHLRECCVTAEMAEVDGAGEYDALLLVEIDRIQRQHRAARSYDLALKASSERAGFAVS
jgi:hypothetical protein